MKLFRLLAAALVAAFITAAAPSAYAASAVMCAPEVSGAATGARTWGGTGSPVPSQTLYALNSAGCAPISQADIGYFQSQGFTFGADSGTIVYTTGVATGTTNFVIGSLPPSTYISMVIYQNTTANAVTGGITLGSTSGGTDISTATTCGANCLAQATDAQLVKRAWSTTAYTPINAAAATAWNSANVTITVVYRYF